MISFEEFKLSIKTNDSLKEELSNRISKKIKTDDIKTELLVDACLSNKTFQDEEFARWCSDHNMKWSDSNFFVSDNIGILSNCCRLLSDTQKLDAFVNSIGGTALSVGSCRVSTINLVRIAYEVLGYNSDRNVSLEVAKRRYIKLLRDRVLLNCKALTSMRHILKRNIEKGLLPNYQEGAVELDKQFCTHGAIGMYEVMDLFGLINTDELGNKSYSKEAIDFTTEILDNINDVKDNFECDFTFNLEMIPRVCGYKMV